MSVNAVKLIGEGAALLAKVPTSALAAVIDVIKALVAGRPDQAERLARNAALAIAAKRAAAERIKAQKR
jgi:hypothetical protein